MRTNIKKLLALLLAALMLFAVVGCNDKKDEPKDETTEAESAEESKEESTDEGDGWIDTDENGNAMRDPNYEVLNYETMKGIWLSQYDMQFLYDSGTKQRNAESFATECDKICKGIAKEGFNTIIVQLRPNGDSFYPSEYFCPSEFVVHEYGKEFEYDMLKIFIQKAHKYKLSFHAWVNPMRLMTDEKIQLVDDKYVIKQWYNDPVKREQYMYKSPNNNYWYLVPGWDEVRELVANGVTEICKNYNIDAMQIDDYFYPVTTLDFDNEHFETVKGQYGQIAPYRIDMVNKLVKQMYDAVHEIKGLEFGISPAGNISNNTSALYADVRRWGKTAGYCDFLIPQVYWGFENSNVSSRFDVCCADWEKLCTAEEVRLIIGMSLDNCRVTNGEGDNAEFFNNKDCIKKQLIHLTTMQKNSGFAMFSYQSIFNKTGAVTGLRAEYRNFSDTLKSFPEVDE